MSIAGSSLTNPPSSTLARGGTSRPSRYGSQFNGSRSSGRAKRNFDAADEETAAVVADVGPASGRGAEDRPRGSASGRSRESSTSSDDYSSESDFQRFGKVFAPDVVERGSLGSTNRSKRRRRVTVVVTTNAYGEPVDEHAVALGVSTCAPDGAAAASTSPRPPPLASKLQTSIHRGVQFVSHLLFGAVGVPAAATVVAAGASTRGDGGNEPIDRCDGDGDGGVVDAADAALREKIDQEFNPKFLHSSLVRAALPQPFVSDASSELHGHHRRHSGVGGGTWRAGSGSDVGFVMPLPEDWYGQSTLMRSMAGGASGMGGGGGPPVDPSLDLVGAMQWFLTTSLEFYGYKVSTALHSRDPRTNPVTAVELEQANRNQFLVTQIIQSGALEMSDEVVREIQACVDELVVPDRLCGGRVNPKGFEYLRVLVQVAGVRLSRSQVSLLKRSGFEFVSLLDEFPELEPVEATASESMRRQVELWLGRRANFALCVFGLLLVCFDRASLAVVGQHWYYEESSFGYITLLCYVGGYVLDLLSMVFLLRDKAHSSVYEGQVTVFPSVNLKAVPFVPVFEFVLLHAIVRHELDAARERQRSGGLRAKHSAILHDLYATSTITRVTHSIFFSVPSVIVQSYLFDWGTLFPGGWGYYGYKLILSSSVSCVIFAVVLFMRQLTVFNSVSYLGYASFGTEPRSHMADRRSTIPRTIAYVMLYLLEINAFFLVIGALNLDICARNPDVIVWVSLSAGVVASCLAYFISSSITTTSVYRAVKGFLLPVAVQTAFTVFIMIKGTSGSTTCRLLTRAGSVIRVVGFVTWSLFGVLGAAHLLVWFRMRRRSQPPCDRPVDTHEPANSSLVSVPNSDAPLPEAVAAEVPT